jgi:hypothetical protein
VSCHRTGRWAHPLGPTRCQLVAEGTYKRLTSRLNVADTSDGFPVEIRVSLKASRFAGWPPNAIRGAECSEREFDVQVDGEETLSSVIARTAGPQLQAAFGGGSADVVPYSVSLIVPGSGAVEELGEVPLLSESGRLRISGARDANLRELLRAHDAGLLAGDPRAIIVRPDPAAFAAGGAGWDAFVEALHVLWTVVEGIGVSYAAFQAVERVLSRFRTGSRVLEEHADDFDAAGVRPPELPRLISLRAWSTKELADAFAISVEEVELLLLGLGFELQPDGRWHETDPLAQRMAAQLLQLASSYEATVREHDRLAELYREYLNNLADERPPGEEA